MALEWQVVSTVLGPSMGNEAWQLVTLPFINNLTRYAFRAVVPVGTPLGWNIAGYFGVVETFAGVRSINRTWPIPLVGRGSNQVIRSIGVGDVDLIDPASIELELAYYINKWVPVDEVEVWGLLDV